MNPTDDELTKNEIDAFIASTFVMSHGYPMIKLVVDNTVCKQCAQEPEQCPCGDFKGEN